MAKTIQQSVTFSAPPGRLFEMYMDAKKHGAAVGSKVTISRRAGGAFSAFNGMIGGRNLAVLPKRLIVQAWRSGNWKATESDSILILTFSKAPGGGRVDMVHANVPDSAYGSIKDGWNTHYWRPWKAYLKKGGGR